MPPSSALLTAVLGTCASTLALAACSCKNDVWLKRMVLFAMCLWAPYYWLLGAQSGFIFSALIVVRQGVSLNLPHMPRFAANAILVVLVLVMTLCLAWTWDGAHSLLPWFSAVNSTYAYMKLRGARLRTQVIVGESGWALYAIVVGAWSHLIFLALALGLSLWTIYRLKRPEVTPI
jgi:Bacterial inner membrane protein